MARYYLVPNETDVEKLKKIGCKKAPKYLEYVKGNLRGVTDWDEKTGKKYYILIFPDDKIDLAKLEEQPDVIALHSVDFNKAALNKIGISVTGNPSKDEIEQYLVSWLTGEQKTLRTL